MLLVDAPSYLDLRDRLLALGWTRHSESQLLPLVPGEPEWVVWVHPAGGKLHYGWDPALELRTIDADGEAAALATLDYLPRHDVRAVRDWLDADDTQTLLRGLFAARAAHLVDLLPRIDALRSHRDALVRTAAEDVARTLPPRAIKAGAERFDREKRRHPDRSVLLASLPVGDRRQVLRWLGADRKTPNTAIDEALRTGLADPDPETRATAVLVACRMGATHLVQEVELPPALARVREVEAGWSPPDPIDDPLMFGLATPIPEVPAPRGLPPWLYTDDRGRTLLRGSDVEMVLIPSVPHVLGDTDRRRITQRPFAIARQALGPLSFAQAEQWVAERTHAARMDLSLPTEDQWEAAIRGPDARPYIAGWLPGAPGSTAWDLLPGEGPEWTADGVLRDSRGPLIERRAPEANERARVRIVAPFQL